jgi:carbamoyl-phosphate synthase small subunit
MRSRLILEDGSAFEGVAFGARRSVSGEVVFNTGMVGYPESLTDPSYKGQILVLTYPLIGNYGVPRHDTAQHLHSAFESEAIQIKGLVVSQYSIEPSHWESASNLDDWLRAHNVPGICGVDTRMLTKRLRLKGSMPGKLVMADDRSAHLLPFYDPNLDGVVGQVSVATPTRYEKGKKTVVVVDCGCKSNIIRSLLMRGVSVLRVPWNYDFLNEDYDGVVLSNGPGDPMMCQPTIRTVKRAMQDDRPIFGICLGHQILALAAGAKTYKLKFGHRSQNQPCVDVDNGRCYITSQNHGFAVETGTLPDGWVPWFVNANDGSNEGIRHRTRPFMSVQFHPEAAPGPTDTAFLFDEFVGRLYL